MVENEELKLLSTLPVFSVLKSKQRKELLDNSHHIFLAKGQALFNMGDIAHSFYLLKIGQVKISLNSALGMEKVLEIVRPGSLFAEAVMFFSENRYPANCVALKKSEVIGFNNQQLVSLIQDSTELSMALLADLSQRLHRKVIEINSLTLENATIRVINYLSTVIPDHTASQINIELDTPKQTIASILSVTPETFSRILKQLEGKQLLKVKRGSIYIPNVENLTNYAYSDHT